MRSFIVSADIEYVDGPLEGLVISEGYKVTHVDPSVVRKVTAWINGSRRLGKEIEAVGSSHRYRFTSDAQTVEAQ